MARTLAGKPAARVGKKFFEKVDVSLNMSYADYGSFYNDTTKKPHADNSRRSGRIYKTYLMVNVPF